MRQLLLYVHWLWFDHFQFAKIGSQSLYLIFPFTHVVMRRQPRLDVGNEENNLLLFNDIQHLWFGNRYAYIPCSREGITYIRY